MKNILLLLFLALIGLVGYFAFTSLVSPLLQPSIGRLSVKATGEASQVLMDGQLIGTTPFYATNLRLGKHKIEVKPPKGSFTWEANITLTKATLSVIDVDLGESKLFSAGENLYFRVGGSGLSLLTYPPGATVEIDNKDKLSAPFDKNLSKGVHTLTVKNSGYLSREVVINIEDGYKLSTTVYLAEDPFGKSSKIDSNNKASIFSVFNTAVNLSDSFEKWAAGIKHVQDSFTGGQTRFDACVDPNGKVYTFNQTEWDNKAATKSVVNIVYLARKDGDELSSKAREKWEAIKKQFN